MPRLRPHPSARPEGRLAVRPTVHACLCAALLSLLAAGCRAEPEAGTARLDAGSNGAPLAAVADAGPAIPWEDPEPPGAQAAAEAAVGAEWNEDKTSRLQMKILPLVDRTTGIEGFGTRLAARETSLDDRLRRLGARVTETEVRIRLPGAILFDFDSAEIRADAERTLADVAAALRELSARRVRVEGHTDSIASDEYNQRLSERRAEAVRGWLAEHGVEAGRLTAAGRGESQPVADNSTAAGRQLNRRVEVVAERGG